MRMYIAFTICFQCCRSLRLHTAINLYSGCIVRLRIMYIHKLRNVFFFFFLVSCAVPGEQCATIAGVLEIKVSHVLFVCSMLAIHNFRCNCIRLANFCMPAPRAIIHSGPAKCSFCERLCRVIRARSRNVALMPRG